MTSHSFASPYWRLSSFYLFYFTALGVFIPYWALYLKHLGFQGSEIGGLFSAVMLTKILAPYIWGWIADHSNRRITIIRFAAWSMVILFCGVFISQQFWWLFLVMFLYSFFWNAMLPQMEVITLNHLEDQHQYGLVRMWGSIGFIAMVMSLGPFLDIYTAAIIPFVLLICYATVGLASLGVSEKKFNTHDATNSVSMLSIIKKPAVISLLIAGFLMAQSHAPYYTFFSIYLENTGYSKTAVGLLWSLGVGSEIIIFLYTKKLMAKFSLHTLLLFCFSVTTVRWILIAFLVDYVSILIIAQLMHAISFGLNHIVMIALIRSVFAGRTHGRGQALYTTISFGLGGAVGALGSGYLWQHAGAQITFITASISALIGLLIIIIGYKITNIATAKKLAETPSQSVGEL